MSTSPLTSGADNVVGSAGDDTFFGVADGMIGTQSTTTGGITTTLPASQTFGALDVITGGTGAATGTDTIQLSNAVGTMTLPTSVKVSGIENLVLTSAMNDVTADVKTWTGLTAVTVDNRGSVTADSTTIDTKANVTSVSVKGGYAAFIEDHATVDTLKTVSLDGTDSTDDSVSVITSDALVNLSLANDNGDVQVVAAAGTRTLNLNLDNQNGGSDQVQDDTATTVAITATGNSSSGVELLTDDATTVTFAGDKAIDIALSDSGARVAAVTSISSTNSAGVSITSTIATGTTFTGGSGDDAIILAAGNAKTITMGAGDDSVAMSAAVGFGGSVDAGTGTDTLIISAANAATLSLTAAFEAGVSNFEKLSIGQVAAGAQNVINLTNIDDISYVISGGTAGGEDGSGHLNNSGVTFSGVTTSVAGANAVAQSQTLTIIQPTNTGIISVGSTPVTVYLGETATQTAVRIAAAIGGTSSGAVVTKAGVNGTAAIVITDPGTTSVTGTFTVATAGSAATAETQTIAITNGTDISGGDIVVAGAHLTLAASMTADQVGGYIAANVAAIKVANSTVSDITYNTSNDTLTFSYTAAAGNVSDLAITDSFSGATLVNTNVTDADGEFILNNMANNGTLELTNVLNSASSVVMKDASGLTDVLNIKLNGANELINIGALTVAGVETIRITTTDSSVDTVALNNPSAASKILLNAVDTTTITVAGNHGVDFTGSILTKVTTLDASGVVSVGDAAAATATTIAHVGAVTFTSAVIDKAVTVTTGNGADTINTSSVTGVAAGVTASTVSTGEGNDTIIGSAGKDLINAGAGDDSVTSGAGADTIDGGAGKDVITGGAGSDTITTGAGNDRVVLSLATDSTLANMDTITDFSANTYGNGTSGAAGTGANFANVLKFTGDVIDLSAFITGSITKVSVAVVGSESAATIQLQNVGDATTDTVGIALDSATGNVYVDINSDGVADSVIHLTGVTTLTNAAFLLDHSM